MSWNPGHQGQIQLCLPWVGETGRGRGGEVDTVKKLESWFCPSGEVIFYEMYLWQERSVKREGFGI